MYELFYKYLLLHNKAYLPGIGNFTVNQIPASMDFEHKKLIPPSQNVTLNATEVGDNYFLYQFLSRELKASEAEVALQVEDFSRDIKSQANQYGSVLLPGIGRLKKGFMGSFDLEVENENKEVLPDIWINKSQAANTTLMEVYSNVTPGILRRETLLDNGPEIVLQAEKEDYWWVFAIILAVMGLGALLYYYI